MKDICFAILAIIFLGCVPSRVAICPDPDKAFQNASISHDFRFKKTNRPEKVKVSQVIPNPLDHDFAVTSGLPEGIGMLTGPELHDLVAKVPQSPMGKSSPKISKELPVNQEEFIASVVRDTVLTQDEKLQSAIKQGKTSFWAALGVIPVTAILPFGTLALVIFGFVKGRSALNLYKTLDSKEGRGYAVAGIVINGVWLSMFLLAIILLTRVLLGFAYG